MDINSPSNALMKVTSQSKIDTATFRQQIQQGITDQLPPAREYEKSVSHAPKRKDSLSPEEKKLAVRNALRYFHSRHHKVLAKEFYEQHINH